MAVYIIKDDNGNKINRLVATEAFVSSHYKNYEEEIQPEEDPSIVAREWRDLELARTDMLMLLSDYPNKEALVSYRQILRDWPSTPDFPDNYPDPLV